MQSYATPTDLRTAGLSRAFWSGDLAPDETQQAEALVANAGIIDSIICVCSSLTLPLEAPYDPTLVRANAIMAAWDLLSARGYDPENPTDRAIYQRYKDTMAWLDKVATGRAKLQHQRTQPNALGVQPDMDGNADRGLRNWSGFVGSGGWQ